MINTAATLASLHYKHRVISVDVVLFSKLAEPVVSAAQREPSFFISWCSFCPAKTFVTPLIDRDKLFF